MIFFQNQKYHWMELERFARILYLRIQDSSDCKKYNAYDNYNYQKYYDYNYHNNYNDTKTYYSGVMWSRMQISRHHQNRWRLSMVK